MGKREKGKNKEEKDRKNLILHTGFPWLK